MFKKLAIFFVKKNIKIHMIEKFLLAFNVILGNFCIFEFALHDRMKMNFFIFYMILLSFEYLLYKIYKKYFLLYYWDSLLRKNLENFSTSLIKKEKENELSLNINSKKF